MKVWHSRSMLMACAAAIAVLSAVTVAAAQDSAAGSSTVLGTITVKGKKAAASVASDTPLATQTTGDEIAKKEISNLGDLGNTTEPGVDFVETRPGDAGGVFIRGLTGPRVATLIDGVPIPYLESSARTGSQSPTTSGSMGGVDSFDFSSLSALDILRGADSSRIGSGALAGALVLRTLNPEDLIEEGRDWGALTKITYDSADNSIAGSAAVAKRFGDTSLLFQGSYKTGDERKNKGDRDIIGTGRTEPNPLDFDQNNLLFKARHYIEGGHTIGLTAERYDYSSDSDLKTLQTTSGGATTFPEGQRWGFDNTRRERVSFHYDYVAPGTDSLVDAASLVLYWQRLQKNAGHDGMTRAPARNMRDNRLEDNSFGLTGHAEREFQSGSLTHRITLGGAGSVSTTEHFLAAIPDTAAQADIPKIDSARVGLFIEDRISMGDSPLAITPGLRFDWHKYTPKYTDEFGQNPGFPHFGLPASRDDARISPKLLATYDLNPSVQLFAQWSMAYRAPTVDELYGNFSNPTTGYAVLGNPDLKAETGHGFEVGADVGSDDFGGRVTVFHNRYKNFIGVETLPGSPPFNLFIQRAVNINKVHITGIEAKAHKRFDNGISLQGGLSYTYGENVETGAVLREIAPFKAVVGIGYDQEHWGVELTGIFAGSMRDDNNPNTFDAPGYGIANFTGWWEPEQIKGMRLQAGVYNIFDKTYYNALRVRSVNPNSVGSANQPVEFYSEPGRTFKVSLTHKF